MVERGRKVMKEILTQKFNLEKNGHLRLGSFAKVALLVKFVSRSVANYTSASNTTSNSCFRGQDGYWSCCFCCLQ